MDPWSVVIVEWLQTGRFKRCGYFLFLMVMYNKHAIEGTSVITEEGHYAFRDGMMLSDHFREARPIEAVAAIEWGIPYTTITGAFDLGQFDRAKNLAIRHGTELGPGKSLVIFFAEESGAGCAITGRILPNDN